ncbi:hypothetical protein A0H76_547 [Hepatospora eriocheir]|uniref:Uncharacterized protein n=1 Tax=Hepatospora eriocheir TaxID=1081669 RepID=A0A1X0Q8L1_9MICR|nr:hypothetical protein A0H76_547 [Hepatospora eriocheir]
MCSRKCANPLNLGSSLKDPTFIDTEIHPLSNLLLLTNNTSTPFDNVSFSYSLLSNLLFIISDINYGL